MLKREAVFLGVGAANETEKSEELSSVSMQPPEFRIVAVVLE